MANERQVANSSAYIELEPSDEQQVASSSAYIELEPSDEQQIASSSAYIETAPSNELQVGHVSAYVEYIIVEPTIEPENVARRTYTPTYEVWLTDPFGRRILLIDRYQSLNLARKVNDIGSLEIIIPSIYPRYLFRIENRIEVWRRVPDGRKLLEGQTSWFIRQIEEFLDKDSVEFMKLSAHDGNGLLKRRIVPYNKGNSNLNADKVQEADDMMKAIMRENYGTLALDTDRDLSAYLAIDADSTLAPQVFKSFSRQVVFNILKDIAETSYSLGTFLAFDVIYDAGVRKFFFRTYINQRGVDRTSDTGADTTLVGPEFGTLSDVSVSDSHDDTYNYVYAGGQSIGDIRAVYEISDDDSIALSPFNRVEYFENASDTDDADELEDAAEASLEAGRPRVAFSGRLELSSSLNFGVDIGFGDRVTVQYNDQTYNVWVNSYSIRIQGSKSDIDVVLKSE